MKTPLVRVTHELVVFSLEKRKQKGNPTVIFCLLTGDRGESRARTFPEVHGESKRRWSHIGWGVLAGFGKEIPMRVVKLWSRLPRGVVGSPFWRIFKDQLKKTLSNTLKLTLLRRGGRCGHPLKLLPT